MPHAIRAGFVTILALAIAPHLVAPARAATSPAALLVDGHPPTHALITHPDGPRANPAADTPMAWSVVGVRLVLQGDSLRELAAAIGAPRPLTAPAQGDDLARIVLRAEGRERTYLIRRAPDGSYALIEPPSNRGGFRMRPDPTRALLNRAAGFRGSFDTPPQDIPLGRTIELPPPYRSAPIELDASTLRTRIYRGLTPPAPAARRLDEEKFSIRLPANYSPRRPAGLLVWVNAGDSGSPPAMFDRSLDDLGLIAVGAWNSGNDRPIADRVQLALDAVATVRERFHIDPARVYITGISGGGKISTLSQACFPEFFTGCLPIVGTGWCGDIAIGNNQVWPRLFARPAPESLRLLRSRRIAQITGPEDFNYGPILAFEKLIRKDADSRLFDIPGMAHTMPPTDAWNEALAWVDEPRRQADTARRERAIALFDDYRARFGEGPPASPAARDHLARITADAPWTDEAWRALELLTRPIPETP